MNIAVIIPDRQDRSELLKNCLRLLNKQTLKPDFTVLASYPPTDDQPDITKRVREAYTKIGNKADVILIFENDDYYAPNYIETVIGQWLIAGKPELFGVDYTVYYNLQLKKYHKFTHAHRASLCQTLIKANMDKIRWPEDNQPYLDQYLWKRNPLKWSTFHPENPISIGIKGHGCGITGGQFHNTRLQKYDQADPQMEYLKSHVDKESFELYQKLINENNIITS